MQNNKLSREYNHEVWLGPGQNIFPASYEKSPPLGSKVEDFTLWNINGAPTHLSALWQAHQFTVVEFGSFT